MYKELDRLTLTLKLINGKLKSLSIIESLLCVYKVNVSKVGQNRLIVDENTIKAFGIWDIDLKRDFDSEYLKQVKKTETHLRNM